MVFAFVVPCYNEEVVLPKMLPVFCDKLKSLISAGRIANESFVLFVNDGSSDRTWEIIENAAKDISLVKGVSLSRNRGHQYALLAGLMEAKEMADVTVSMDCDGQDDIGVVDDMIESYRNGSEIVYGVRNSRESDTWFKRTTAQGFYRLMKCLGIDVIYNHADYRLSSSRALDELGKFTETNLFLRGLFPLVGFKHSVVYYERMERTAGESHYPLMKMLALAIEGITSLSIKPVRYVTALGGLMAFLSVGMIVAQSVVKFFGVTLVDGGMPIWDLLLCGVQLLSLGIIGEYVGKTYMEVKRRPRYIIDKRTFGG